MVFVFNYFQVLLPGTRQWWRRLATGWTISKSVSSLFMNHSSMHQNIHNKPSEKSTNTKSKKCSLLFLPALSFLSSFHKWKESEYRNYTVGTRIPNIFEWSQKDGRCTISLDHFTLMLTAFVADIGPITIEILGCSSILMVKPCLAVKWSGI